jgi:hypothetical protein
MFTLYGLMGFFAAMERKCKWGNGALILPKAIDKLANSAQCST